MRDDAVTTPWIKSSYSNSGANCVEVAQTALGLVAVRDSKDPRSLILHFTPRDWTAFVSGVRSGEIGLAPTYELGMAKRGFRNRV